MLMMVQILYAKVIGYESHYLYVIRMLKLLPHLQWNFKYIMLNL